MNTIGIKKIRDSEIGNETSHATHIGLYQNVLINKEEHQAILSNIYFENNTYPTVSFIDFIKREDGTFNAPKVRKGTDEDNYQINGVRFESAFVKFQEIFHSREEDKNWYLVFLQNSREEIDFYLIMEDSQEFQELIKIFGDSFDRKEITEGDREYEDVISFIKLNFNVEILPSHGIRNIWWGKEEIFYMVNPGAESLQETIFIEKPFLWAPFKGRDNKPQQNTMVALVKKGDIVFVYNEQAITGYLTATGDVYGDKHNWTLGGDKGKKKGYKKEEVEGFKVDLDKFNEFEKPITLEEIRNHEIDILNLRDELKATHKTLYFPFNHSSGPRADKKKVIMAKEGYLTKFPKSLVKILNIDIELENNETEDSDNPINLEGFVDTQRREYDTYVTKRELRDLVLNIHNYKCQFCNNKNEYINSNLERVHYAEGAHIKAKNPTIGGEDKLDNLLCLCPTCHKLFDLGAYWMDDELTIRDIDNGIVYQLNEKEEHNINLENVKFHRDFFKERRN